MDPVATSVLTHLQTATSERLEIVESGPGVYALCLEPEMGILYPSMWFGVQPHVGSLEVDGDEATLSVHRRLRAHDGSLLDRMRISVRGRNDGVPERYDIAMGFLFPLGGADYEDVIPTDAFRG